MQTNRCSTWLAGALLALGGLLFPQPAQAQIDADGDRLQVIAEGRGWRLLEVRPPAGGGETGVAGPPRRVWAVHRHGVDYVPVSEFQRTELRVDFERSDGSNAVIFVDQAAADAAEHRVASGEAPDAESGCFGWNTKRKQKSYDFSDFNPSGDLPIDFGGLTGSYDVNVPLSGQANIDMRYKIKKAFCVPYKFEFLDARVFGDATFNGDGSLAASATLQGHWDKEWKLAEPRLGDFWIYFVEVEVTLPIYVGVSVDASLTGSVGLDADFSGSGTFDYTCTTNGCTGSNTFTDSFDLEDSTASLELDIDTDVWARVMGRLSAYSSSILYVEGGLKGVLHADLWGYHGNTCGDGDLDGNNETVRALTADVGWSADRAYGWGWLGSNHLSTNPGSLNYLGWWDLLGSGGSTALAPMLLGPAEVEQGRPIGYTVKMRPCYPYSDRVDFTIQPGDWSGNKFIPEPGSSDPARNSSDLSRSFNQVGLRTVTATATSDAFGRDLGVSFSRELDVVPPPCTDVTPPQVSLTSPTAGDYVWGTTLFEASASDDVGVTRVDYKINGQQACTANQAPWSCSDNLDDPTGDYHVRALAHDACGNVATSANTLVRIVSNPEMHVGQPAPDSTVSGTDVQVLGWATDPDGVSDVSLTVDGQATIPAQYGQGLAAVCQAVPLNDPNCPHVGFETSFDSRQYSNGVHAMRFVATDATGRTTERTHSFTVDNTTTEPCVADATTLCLRGNRFEVRVSYVSGSTYAAARAHSYSDQSGFFWFFGQDNLETGVKILGPANGYWWVFHGAATDRQYTLSVTDTQTGVVQSYVKPAGSFCGGTDLQAFPEAGAGAVAGRGASLRDGGEVLRLLAGDAPSGADGSCVSTGTSACVQEGRFRVEVLRSGVPQPSVELTADTAGFWFFNGANAEVFVKVLGPVNDGYWVFYGSLSDLDYTIRVTDTTDDRVVTYTNPLGTYCGNGDTGAF
jgi:hypothetical protein